MLAEEILRELLSKTNIPDEEHDNFLTIDNSDGINNLLKESNKPNRILLIDADPQFNLTNNIGIDVRTSGLKTTQQIFETSAKAEELIYKSAIKGLPNIDIIPASLFMTKTEINLVSRTGRELIFSNFINDNMEHLNENYRYILIDTNPNLYMINQNVFLASDNIIIVSDVSYNSISGAEFFMALWEELKSPLNKPFDFKAIVVNKYDNRPNNRSKDFLEYCNHPDNEEIAKLLIKEYIPLNERIADTETAHIPINILPAKTSSEQL
jgi:chromosome partitioning protein